MKNKRAQITLFVIIAIIIVAVFVLVFTFRGKIIPQISGKPIKNPEAFLSSCLEEKIREGIKIISSQGGYVNHSLYLDLDNERIHYLCFTQNYYLPCINQEPMLIKHLSDELHDYIEDDVENCFAQLEDGLKKEGYEVDLNYKGFEIILIPKKVTIQTESSIVLKKTEESTRQENLKIAITSRFYDLAEVVQEILSQEARFCNFDIQGFMLFYNEFDVDKFKTGNSETIYTIKHRKSQEEFKFALRGCVIPPGF